MIWKWITVVLKLVGDAVKMSYIYVEVLLDANVLTYVEGFIRTVLLDRLAKRFETTLITNNNYLVVGIQKCGSCGDLILN